MKLKVPYLVPRARDDGTTSYYWVPKKTYRILGKEEKCPFEVVSLGKDENDAVHQATQLNEHLKEWRGGGKNAQSQTIKKDTLSWVIAQFRNDEHYLDTGRGTQKFYDSYIPIIDRLFGDLHPKVVTRKMARSVYRTFKSQPYKANGVMATARIIFRHAIDEGLIETNPFKEQKVKKPPPRSQKWSAELIELFQETAIKMGRPSMALAIQMGYDLGQRPQDLRTGKWPQWVKGKFRAKQLKGGEWIEVKALAGLRRMLNDTERTSIFILICESTGQPYSKDRFCKHFREVCDKAGIPKTYQFRDLRRTAVVRLAESGCTIAEICAVTGHSLKQATEILRTYMPLNTAMADSGIARIEEKEQQNLSSN